VARRLLDTSVLVAYWRHRRSLRINDATVEDAKRWAEELIEQHGSRAIATPVSIEFLAGTRSGHELRLARSYLDHFAEIDHGRITPDDWRQARRMAERVPPNGKPRQMGDCLIRAVAKRLNHEIVTLDQGLRSLKL